MATEIVRTRLYRLLTFLGLFVASTAAALLVVSLVTPPGDPEELFWLLKIAVSILYGGAIASLLALAIFDRQDRRASQSPAAT